VGGKMMRTGGEGEGRGEAGIKVEVFIGKFRI
jgi:hypothetical protein